MSDELKTVTAEPTDGANAIEWARAVLWAAENVGTAKISKKAAGSLARFIYWKQGRENPKQLLVDFVPRALSILDKNKGDGPGSGMQAAESERIGELEELLEDALAEAGLK